MHIYAHYCAYALGDVLRAKPKKTMYLRYPDMAAELGVSLRTLKGWVASRLVPYVKVKRLVLFEPAKVKAALERLERKAVSSEKNTGCQLLLQRAFPRRVDECRKPKR
jgi:hypothetical protein